MGDYQYMMDQTDDTVGVIRTADGAMIPPDPANADWQEYLVWKAVPNTPDACTATSLSNYKVKKQILLDAEFEAQIQATLPVKDGGPAVAFLLSRAIQEAQEFADGETPADSTRYPILNGMVDAGGRGATISAVSTSVLSDWSSIKATLGGIYKVRDDAYYEIENAANEAAVDAVSWTWP